MINSTRSIVRVERRVGVKDRVLERLAFVNISGHELFDIYQHHVMAYFSRGAL